MREAAAGTRILPDVPDPAARCAVLERDVARLRTQIAVLIARIETLEAATKTTRGTP